MPNWTHLVRFTAVEDGLPHLGQLVDTTKDVGLELLNGGEVQAYLINGDIYNGIVTDKILHVKEVGLPEQGGRDGIFYALTGSCTAPESRNTRAV